jgi:hypothetical protein
MLSSTWIQPLGLSLILYLTRCYYLSAYFLDLLTRNVGPWFAEPERALYESPVLIFGRVRLRDIL